MRAEDKYTVVRIQPDISEISIRSQRYEQLFEQMVFHTLAEDLTTESKAAELLAIPLIDFHTLRNLERADAAAYQ